jgi:hypothetical protein
MANAYDQTKQPPTPSEPVPQRKKREFENRLSGRWPDPDVERAQPGDVLGIERDGETTELGDTAESEDKKRRDAEKAAEE